jgi:holo-[acyl-carrier protein] synthase
VIVGAGIDLVETERIRRTVARFGRRFLERVFTPGEIAYAERKRDPAERYAARFAAKEAAMKAIGTGLRRGVRWRDFEVANRTSGKPELLLHGRAAQIAAALKVRRSTLSLTHTKGQAVALVILEG